MTSKSSSYIKICGNTGINSNIDLQYSFPTKTKHIEDVLHEYIEVCKDIELWLWKYLTISRDEGTWRALFYFITSKMLEHIYRENCAVMWNEIVINAITKYRVETFCKINNSVLIKRLQGIRPFISTTHLKF